MKLDKLLVVRFCGLDNGPHRFDFEIDGEFFKRFDNPDFDNCKFNIVADLLKEETLMTVDLHVVGSVIVPCDRCLAPLTLPVDASERLFVKVGEGPSDDDSVLFITKDDIQFDVDAIVYDIITLSIPYRKIHPDNEDGTPTCDPEQLSYLEQCKKTEEIDPRWDKLKDLK
ncbi:MAG: DUF177 domain-containing protein [Bacteroidales bacterium]|nr:DUF177 domain-containing protein [Bacteroidales bacterium]MDD2205286.1 DUF177 domain-containing protein [Bacteroidales bacterium]MDD3151712.1 DUF177 domain-containing protein [Bacteroidales bacterium]MDD3914254.1 DUF177 domain-containing protein [Bacteroidales bacterium]MDD4633431.1 DUF177 domain-containing protein [Bacteroidales bacterium]